MIYAYDRSEPIKREVARRMLASEPETLVVSTQVLVESYSVARKQLAMDHGTAAALVERLARFRVVGADARLVVSAIALAHERQISHWDALMVRAAQIAGCDRLLTEDLQDGARFGDVVIENPFSQVS